MGTKFTFGENNFVLMVFPYSTSGGQLVYVFLLHSLEKGERIQKLNLPLQVCLNFLLQHVCKIVLVDKEEFCFLT